MSRHVITSSIYVFILIITLLLISIRSVYAADTDITSGTEATVPWRITSDYKLIIGKSGERHCFSKDIDYKKRSWYSYRKDVKEVIFEGDVIIGEYSKGLFYGFENITSISLPESITKIGSKAFYSCVNLSDIKIPDNVIYISGSAFSWCTNLNTVHIPNGIKVIGSFAFYRCDKLTEITIPNGIEEIMEDTFSCCSSLKNISLPNSLITIGNRAFSNCSSLDSIVIPDSVKTIGEYAFSGCDDIEELIIPNNVTDIQEGAFCGCNRLSKVTILAEIEEIKSKAFDSCNRLRSISIPTSVNRISSDAFTIFSYIYYNGNENQWDSIIADDRIKKARVFYNSYMPEYDPDEIPYMMVRKIIGEYRDTSIENSKASSFDYLDLSDIQREELYSISKEVTKRCTTDYEKIKAICGFVADNIYYDDEERNSLKTTYDVWKGKRAVCDGYARLSSVLLNCIDIPCFYIIGFDHAYNAAYDSRSRRWVYFDSTGCSKNYYQNGEWHYHGYRWSFFDMSINAMLISPREYEMYNINYLSTQNGEVYYKLISGDDWGTVCSFVNVDDWYLSVMGLKNNRYHTLLNMVSDLNGIPVKEISTGAFYGCTINNIVIPEGIETIGAFSFYNCSALTSISIPRTIAEIHEDAFYECKKLQTVNYSGTVSEWKKINISEGNECLKNATITCIDGIINNEKQIVRKDNPLIVKAARKTVKYKKVKSKATTVKAITVKKAQGKVRYKKISGTSALKINYDTGKVTVKKGTHKGVYKAKVKVTASGNAKYKFGYKMVTVTINVK